MNIIPGTGGKYWATPEGQIIGPRGHALKPMYDRHGYQTVSIPNGDRQRPAGIGPRPQGLEVRHLNGNKLDNRPENLRYGTRRENSLDKSIHGTDHNSSKTHCKLGHEFTPENTYLYTKRGKRERTCKACRQVRVTASKARAKARRLAEKTTTESSHHGTSALDV